ncbi:MAG: M48 family metallopeptidase [Candidatus Pacebacteria bacterium]|nr:M48 family metallopeptidase [Candidatus Paceibacterota bacterium]
MKNPEENKMKKQKYFWVVRRVRRRVSLRGTKKDYLKYKDQAMALAQNRIEYFNKIYGLKYNKINIKNQKTRWGSCSKKGNLNFNYKIALLPERLADYIIVHELCHLKEFNHGQKFWNLVAKAVPEYSKLKRGLKITQVLPV